MKLKHILFIATAIAFPLSAQAQLSADSELQKQIMQQLQTMSAEERAAMMGGVMQNMGAIQTCIQEAGGEETLKNLQQLGETHTQKVKAMCASGERDAAQSYAKGAAQDLQNDPRIKKLRACSGTALKNTPQLARMVETASLDTKKHVCDAFSTTTK